APFQTWFALHVRGPGRRAGFPDPPDEAIPAGKALRDFAAVLIGGLATQHPEAAGLDDVAPRIRQPGAAELPIAAVGDAGEQHAEHGGQIVRLARGRRDRVEELELLRDPAALGDVAADREHHLLVADLHEAVVEIDVDGAAVGTGDGDLL